MFVLKKTSQYDDYKESEITFIFLFFRLIYEFAMEIETPSKKCERM